ncbi:MAG: hypothetical protein EOP22_08575 [Hyphomicrobiales bacterium]|nr:MAG: hypothetical protein EOP22_08575 [Hyphomicrobiales bacterium]
MDMQEQEVERPRRKTDTSNAEARQAIADTVSRFPAWRSDLAQYAVIAERRFSTAERQRMLDRCEVIMREVQEARVALVMGLMDAPRMVAGHSRVSDVEKALDGVEASVNALRRRLRDS